MQVNLLGTLVEVIVVTVVGHDSTERLVVCAIDGTRRAGVLAVLKVIRVAIGKHRELKHHFAIAFGVNRELLVVLELMRVRVADVARFAWSSVDLVEHGTDVDVATGALTAVNRRFTTSQWLRNSNRSESDGKDLGEHDGRETGTYPTHVPKGRTLGDPCNFDFHTQLA